MKKIFYLLIIFCFSGCSDETSMDETVDINYNNVSDLSDNQNELYKLIMQYRKENNLPIIPLSKSLTKVAQTHVIDLQDNQPVGGKCNLHSWSDKGSWTRVCYTGDHKQSEKMWSKPRELTSYKGNGYEISYGGKGFKATPASALKSWKGSPGHANVILNKGSWKGKWNAIGVGIYGGYSVVWFGREVDEEK